MGHGIQVVTPITEKTKRQIGVLFVDKTSLWEGLQEEEDDMVVLLKGKDSINSWSNNLLVVGGEPRPENAPTLSTR